MSLYLARLSLNTSRQAMLWLSNPYRVHQRLMMAFNEGDPRLLFRIEAERRPEVILVQAHRPGDWQRAFGEFAVLERPPEEKPFEVNLSAAGVYHFRLQANPAVKRAGKRLGLLREDEQREWLERKLQDAGAQLLGCTIRVASLQRSTRSPAKDPQTQTHLAVRFDGVLRATDPQSLALAVEQGVGPAKAYGFGLLSLAGFVG